MTRAEPVTRLVLSQESCRTAADDLPVWLRVGRPRLARPWSGPALVWPWSARPWSARPWSARPWLARPGPRFARRVYFMITTVPPRLARTNGRDHGNEPVASEGCGLTRGTCPGQRRERGRAALLTGSLRWGRAEPGGLRRAGLPATGVQGARRLAGSGSLPRAYTTDAARRRTLLGRTTLPGR
jgi:hypothetical protein